MKTTIAIIAALSLASAAFSAENAADSNKLPPASDKKDVTYQKDIKPIFETSCVKCHSGEKAKGKLHLDSLAGALKGGHDGKVILPGNSAKSDLVLSVAHIGDEESWMPPLRNRAGIKPLTGEQIGLIRAWIDQGAK
jgi:mono/diheme cytochrome c family protein